MVGQAELKSNRNEEGRLLRDWNTKCRSAFSVAALIQYYANNRERGVACRFSDDCYAQYHNDPEFLSAHVMTLVLRNRMTEAEHIAEEALKQKDIENAEHYRMLAQALIAVKLKLGKTADADRLYLVLKDEIGGDDDMLDVGVDVAVAKGDFKLACERLNRLGVLVPEFAKKKRAELNLNGD